MRDCFTGKSVEDLEMAVDIFIKSCSKSLVYFKRDQMPTLKNSMYYLDVEYELLDHQIMKTLG